MLDSGDIYQIRQLIRSEMEDEIRSNYNMSELIYDTVIKEWKNKYGTSIEGMIYDGTDPERFKSLLIPMLRNALKYDIEIQDAILEAMKESAKRERLDNMYGER